LIRFFANNSYNFEEVQIGKGEILYRVQPFDWASSPHLNVYGNVILQDLAVRYGGGRLGKFPCLSKDVYTALITIEPVYMEPRHFQIYTGEFRLLHWYLERIMKKYLLFTLVSILSASSFSQQVLILSAPCENPRYEGFGENVTGGLEQSVYHVTNLNDSGTDSLRDAVSQGNRCIVFDIGGTINLSSDLRVSSNTTIDGLSAPSPGITLRGRTLIMEDEVNNIIVRGIRVRGSSDDGIRVFNSHDIVIDHVSVSDFGDGAVDITQNSYNVTLSWSILGNGTPNHNFPTLISYETERISVHHNLYSNSADRNPKCALNDNASSNQSNEVTCDVRNNLIWNYKFNGSRNDNGANVNVISNYYYSSSNNLNGITANSGARVYAAGNYSKNGYNLNSQRNVSLPFTAAAVHTRDAITAANLVLSNAGARGDNFGLDDLDRAYIDQVDINIASSTSTPAKTAPSTQDSDAPICLIVVERTGVRLANTLWSPAYDYKELGEIAYVEALISSKDPPEKSAFPAIFARVGQFSYFVTKFRGRDYVKPCP